VRTGDNSVTKSDELRLVAKDRDEEAEETMVVEINRPQAAEFEFSAHESQWIRFTTKSRRYEVT